VQMSIVFHEAGLKCIEIPCVAQTFVNHNARLFKVFVIGDKQFVVERPSLKNFIAGGESEFFQLRDECSVEFDYDCFLVFDTAKVMLAPVHKLCLLTMHY